jgi:hypothetical protein
MERITDSSIYVQKESNFFLGDWSLQEKAALVIREIKEIFANPVDNESFNYFCWD